MNKNNKAVDIIINMFFIVLCAACIFPLLLTFAHTLGRERVFTRLVTGIALLEEDYPEADLACCGFPENWREILENEIS